MTACSTFCAEIGFRRLLHLLQDEGGDLRGRIGLAVGLDPGVAVAGAHDLVGDELLVLLDHRVVVAPADQALDREDGAFGIGDRLALGRLADEPLAVVGEGDDRGRGAHALRVLDDLRRLAFHHGDARIGGAEVDADDLAHGSHFLFSAAGRPGPFGTRQGRFRETRGPLVRPPLNDIDAAPCGVLAHIGGPLWAASHPITDSRAAGLTSI